MSETFYRKSGRRYVATPETPRLYADGIWLVQENQRCKSCILKLGELPSLYPFAQMAIGLDVLTGIVENQRRERDNSSREIAKAVLRWMATQTL